MKKTADCAYEEEQGYDVAGAGVRSRRYAVSGYVTGGSWLAAARPASRS